MIQNVKKFLGTVPGTHYTIVGCGIRHAAFPFLAHYAPNLSMGS